MKGVDKAISTLSAYAANSTEQRIAVSAQLLTTVAYLCAVLSVPLLDPARLVWLFCFPIIMAEWQGAGYLSIFKKSLWVLPLIVLIGIFNPLIDRVPQITVGNIAISRGWVSFISIVLRGLLSVQALLILISSCGFLEICRTLRSIGVPAVLVTQLMMLYRYMIVLLAEAQTMEQARQARGFGRKSYPLSMWSTFIGQLLLRSIDRAKRVHRAMLARGFNGDIAVNCRQRRWDGADFAFVIIWIAVFAALRFINITTLLGSILLRNT